jgi:antitoxin (DNA-binding transcriptional repressor) of toxin-antitoxin stability system
MKASFVDLRKKSAEIIQALDRNEKITILYRGRPKAIMQPIAGQENAPAVKAKDHPAFGLWADRDDLKDVTAHVRELRKGRFDAL